jgi:hypothetical protein
MVSVQPVAEVAISLTAKQPVSGKVNRGFLPVSVPNPGPKLQFQCVTLSQEFTVDKSWKPTRNGLQPLFKLSKAKLACMGEICTTPGLTNTSPQPDAFESVRIGIGKVPPVRGAV